MRMTSTSRQTGAATFKGFLAVVLFSTAIAGSRHLGEQVGALTTGALMYGGAGLVGLIVLAINGQLRATLSMPLAYLVGAGIWVVIYGVALYNAIHLCQTRVQLITVSIIQYIWPTMVLVLSVPILGNRTRPGLLIGILLGLAGIILALYPAGTPLAEWPATVAAHWVPAALALVAGVSWGMFSNLSAKLGGTGKGSGMPLFLLATGIGIGACLLFFPEQSQWTVEAGTELAYLTLVSTFLAAAFWETAMRRGNVVLVAAISYLTPLLSTIMCALLLKVQPGACLWLACLLTIAGAWICKLSITPRTAKPCAA